MKQVGGPNAKEKRLPNLPWPWDGFKPLGKNETVHDSGTGQLVPYLLKGFHKDLAWVATQIASGSQSDTVKSSSLGCMICPFWPCGTSCLFSALLSPAMLISTQTSTRFTFCRPSHSCSSAWNYPLFPWLCLIISILSLNATFSRSLSCHRNESTLALLYYCYPRLFLHATYENLLLYLCVSLKPQL